MRHGTNFTLRDLGVNDRNVMLCQDWKEEHGRRYVVGSQEEMFRMKIWMDNKIKIEKHNKLFHEVRV